MDAPVLIVGAGTFGLSAAYHLAEAGYTDITVLDKAASIPSRFSAGYDLNKIVRAEYPDAFYADKALAAIRAWKTTPLFAPYYRETGYLIANSASAPAKTVEVLRAFRASLAPLPAFADSVCDIETRADIRRVAPQFDGPAAGWTGYFNQLAGYARAADAMGAVYAHCQTKRGVRFVLGDAVTELLYASSSPNTPHTNTCIGAKTAAGHTYRAATTIVALGAWAAGVLPGLGQQQRALGVPVVHIEVTPAEAEALRGLPVTFCRDLGFLFEPDPATRRIKLCPANGGYLYFDHGRAPDGTHTSLPPDDPALFTFTPHDDEARLRRLLRDVLPALADRPFVDTRFCWLMDTTDHDYVIDFVPGVQGLVALSGDSGHGYKMLPVLGEWVVALLAAGEQTTRRWKWKGTEERPHVSTRAFAARDITDPSLRQSP